MKTLAKILIYPILTAAALACIVLTIWNLEAFFATIEVITFLWRIIMETAFVGALLCLALAIDKLLAHGEITDNLQFGYFFDIPWALILSIPLFLNLLFGALYLFYSILSALSGFFKLS